jgi:hypothetical protein
MKTSYLKAEGYAAANIVTQIGSLPKSGIQRAAIAFQCAAIAFAGCGTELIAKMPENSIALCKCLPYL